jgi:hypothetical protein
MNTTALRSMLPKMPLMAALVAATLLPNHTVAGEAEGKTSPPIAPTAVVTMPAVAPGEVQVFLDITGSFVDVLLSSDGDFLRRSIKRVTNDLNATPMPNGTLVRVSIIGHSSSSQTAGGSNDHLAARQWTVGGKTTREKVLAGVRGWLNDIAEGLSSGRIKPQNNTAVIMAFDRAAELGRQQRPQGASCQWWAISDLDDTEVGLPLPAPFTPGEMRGCTLVAIGAGVTLQEGTKAERQLRRAWLDWTKQAGAKDLAWISNP